MIIQVFRIWRVRQYQEDSLIRHFCINLSYDAMGATDPDRKLFGGHCQVIFRTTAEPGEIRLTASGQGLTPAVLTLNSEACLRAPHVAQELETDAMWYFAKMDGPH